MPLSRCPFGQGLTAAAITVLLAAPALANKVDRLDKAEKTDFQLAQLTLDDLLAARARPLGHVGDVVPAPAVAMPTPPQGRRACCTGATAATPWW